MPEDDPAAVYLSDNLWTQDVAPGAWETARLSHAVYLYREAATQWAVVAKFYEVKADALAAERHATREFESTRQARACCILDNRVLVPQPLAVWRGVLFLEYINGLTLEDVIAVRRSRPGTLLPSLSMAVEMLATLHVRSVQGGSSSDFEEPPIKAQQIVGTLVKHGILHDDPIVAEGLLSLIKHWAAKPVMRDYVPTYVHGDATTTNFVFPWNGGVAGIDWERFNTADPAADLGRLLAEISHSLKQHGGSVQEAVPELEHTIQAYCQMIPADWDRASLLTRAQFYRAISTLRIARNGWVSRLDRTALVAQALALLSG
ncbi:MAG: aminoglycoside phosphotransferase family protein [Anaerolineae bacterium]|nr:aminoglycoside phosphotransferase family protein [Anaerolineae bacterium]